MSKKSFNCPAELTVSLIGGKWKSILIYNLRKGGLRFGELRRRAPGINPATLTLNLRELEESGLIRQMTLGSDRLDGVEYRLTAKGESLKPVIDAMIRWGIAHQKDYVAGDFKMAVFQK